MPQTNTGVCELGELTLRELAGLHILNEALREAERWIREHSVPRQYRSESDTEGLSHSLPKSVLPAKLTRASVVCLSVATEPCDVAAHSHVVRLEATTVLEAKCQRAGAKETAFADEGLFGLQPCALFRKLIIELRGDWMQMLAVRTLKAELTAAACREFEVASAVIPRRTSNFLVHPVRLQAHVF